MHGKQFILDAVYAGIDEHNLYGRLDFHEIPPEPVQLIVNLEIHSLHASSPAAKPIAWRLEVDVDRQIRRWELRRGDEKPIATSDDQTSEVIVALARTFEFRIPIVSFRAKQESAIHLRFSLWREGLPIDALPLEGAVVIPVITEDQMAGELYNYSVSS
jgi:hypothetical protein